MRTGYSTGYPAVAIRRTAASHRSVDDKRISERRGEECMIRPSLYVGIQGSRPDLPANVSGTPRTIHGLGGYVYIYIYIVVNNSRAVNKPI